MSDRITEAREALSEWVDHNKGLINSGAKWPREVAALRDLIAEHERLIAPPTDNEREALTQGEREWLEDFGDFGEALLAKIDAGFRRHHASGAGRLSRRRVESALTDDVAVDADELDAMEVEFAWLREESTNTPRRQGPVTEAERSAIQEVLWNASNYPVRAQPHVLGKDITPLVTKVVTAIESARNR